MLKFDDCVFSLNSKTEVKDESDNLLCWGINDFSFKHRRRTFIDNDEIFYIQLLIETDNNKVIVCDNKDNEFFNVVDEKIGSNGFVLEGDIYNWKFDVYKDGEKVMSSLDKYELDTYDTDYFECIKFIFSFARFSK